MLLIADRQTDSHYVARQAAYLAVHALDSGATIASVVSGLVDIWLGVLEVDGE